jgi:hypothetical protein
LGLFVLGSRRNWVLDLNFDSPGVEHPRPRFLTSHQFLLFFLGFLLFSFWFQAKISMYSME